jgi:phage shock protein PspC (stress-responsive transcriptional regulator)
MKKVININFQGRVIPIEESAYDMLKRYVDSLRVFFATEEGRDEIINDIEGRIAELFGEILKKGSTCITDADVETIIASMGRPEDFEADEAKVQSQLGGENTRHQTFGGEQHTTTKRLYRDENHKVIAGVCSGVANYVGVDPVVVRILTILFVGVTLIPYIILWIAVPSSTSAVIGAQRRRLFRDPDGKMIAGVCSGLAQYFNINVWIPRVLFLLPFISFAFRFNHDWGPWGFPQFITWSFSPTSLFVYIVLWLVVPEAKSAADKLEMKGEKVDLNNIKTTIQSDLEQFRDRAQQFGNEVKERARHFTTSNSATGDPTAASAYSEIDEARRADQATMSATAPVAEPEPVIRSRRRGLGDIIALIAKVFAYLILGFILLGVVLSLFALGIATTGLLPLKDYIIRDGWENLFAWGTLILFIWVPVIGIITWIIRRLTKKRGNSSFITFTFVTLWIAGIICLIGLITSLRNDFRYRNYPAEQAVPLANPAVNKLEVKIAPFGRYYDHGWLRLEPFASFDQDTVYLRNVRVRVVKATGDSFQVKMVKLTNGRTRQEAENLASKIDYSARQVDTTLILDKGITLTPNEKFRNQQVILTIAVPVGKRILINENVGWGPEANLNFGDRDNYWDWENEMESESLHWRHNVEYVMTQKGLERTDKLSDDDDNNNGDNNSNETIEQFRKSKEQMEKEKEQKLKELQEIDKELQKVDSTAVDSSRYHYRPTAPQAPQQKRSENKSAAVAYAPGISDMLMIKFAL